MVAAQSQVTTLHTLLVAEQEEVTRLRAQLHAIMVQRDILQATHCGSDQVFP